MSAADAATLLVLATRLLLPHRIRSRALFDPHVTVCLRSSCWVVTGGTFAGVMREVAEPIYKYEPSFQKTPVIGISPLSKVHTAVGSSRQYGSRILTQTHVSPIQTFARHLACIGAQSRGIRPLGLREGRQFEGQYKFEGQYTVHGAV